MNFLMFSLMHSIVTSLTSCCYLSSLIHCLQYQTFLTTHTSSYGILCHRLFCSLSTPQLDYCLFFQSLNTVLSMSSWSFVPRFSLRHPFCSNGCVFSRSKWLYIFSANITVISFHIKGRQDIGLQLSTLVPFARSFWHSSVSPKVIQSVKGLSPSRI